MTAQRVRTHTRKTATGGTTTVRQHSRKGRPRRPLVSPGHAWRLLRAALRAGRRHKQATAVALTGLAAGELAAWLTLRGAGFMLATAGLLAIAVAAAAIAAAGGELR